MDRLKLGLSHLNEHRYNHNFANCTNPKYLSNSEDEPSSPFFWHCIFYIPVGIVLFEELKAVDNNLCNLTDNKLN